MVAISGVSQQNLAFKCNTCDEHTQPKKRHLGAAIASYYIPGSGQIAKGEIKSGLARLGVDVAATAVIVGAALQLAKGKISEATYMKAAVLSWGTIVANHVNSAFDAFKPKGSKEHNPTKATASCFIPGSGQFAKGEVKKGIAHIAMEVGIIGTGAYALKYIGKTIGALGKDAKQFAVNAYNVLKDETPVINFDIRKLEEMTKGEASKKIRDFGKTEVAKNLTREAGDFAAKVPVGKLYLATITLMLAPTLILANHVRSAIDAFKPQKVEQ